MLQLLPNRLIKIWVLIFFGTLFVTRPALAEETEESPWEGDAKLGFIFSKTDNRSLSVNTAANLSYDVDKWKQTVGFSSYFTGTDDSSEEGTNKYRVIYDVQYSLDERKFLYWDNTYEHDQFATYRDQMTTAAGFGATLIDDGTTTLEVGAGPGYRFSRRQSTDPDYPKQREDELIANGFVDFNSKINDSVEYGAKINTDYGAENTATNVTAYIKDQLMESLSLSFDVEYIYNSVVASDKSNDEIYSTISLNYDF